MLHAELKKRFYVDDAVHFDSSECAWGKIKSYISAADSVELVLECSLDVGFSAKRKLASELGPDSQMTSWAFGKKKNMMFAAEEQPTFTGAMTEFHFD